MAARRFNIPSSVNTRRGISQLPAVILCSVYWINTTENTKPFHFNMFCSPKVETARTKARFIT